MASNNPHKIDRRVPFPCLSAGLVDLELILLDLMFEIVI